jgi:hypothetical protein
MQDRLVPDRHDDGQDVAQLGQIITADMTAPSTTADRGGPVLLSSPSRQAASGAARITPSG